MTQTNLAAAYQFCQQLALSHYENFPVASLLLPKRLRLPVSVIYAFSRTADDFADEGQRDPSWRLQQLERYQSALNAIADAGYHGENPIFIALENVVNQFNLPLSLLHDLLKAFEQDVSKSRYADFAEVLEYCHYSANPVGRLLLHLQGQPTQQQLRQSDNICTALQLINFYQDIEQDYREQNRIYLPQDELAAWGISENDLLKADTSRIAPLLRKHYQQVAGLMLQGYMLGCSIPGRLGWEIRAITLGGIKTLSELNKQLDHQLLTRPRLGRLQLLFILWKSRSCNSFQKNAETLLAPFAT